MIYFQDKYESKLVLESMASSLKILSDLRRKKDHENAREFGQVAAKVAKRKFQDVSQLS